MTPTALSGQITQEAADWLFLHDRGLTSDEAERFAAWLAASPENERTWLRTNDIFQAVDAVPDPILDAMRRDALAARPAWFRRRWSLVGGAMAALLLGIIGVSVWPAGRDPQTVTVDAHETAPLQLASTTGQRRSIALPDGSVATLDVATRLAWSFDHDRRHVEVRSGQAFFGVRHGDVRPFEVAAADRVVTATGTAFVVRRDPAGMAAALIEGKVVVRRSGGQEVVALAPGQMLTAPLGAASTVSKVDPLVVLSWRDGFLEFTDTPLADAVAQVNRYTSAPIRLADAATGRLRISGRFRTGDAAGFAATVTQVLPVRRSVASNHSTILKGR